MVMLGEYLLFDRSITVPISRLYLSNCLMRAASRCVRKRSTLFDPPIDAVGS